MNEDPSTIPRRLRRFYRKGIPIPETLKKTPAHSANPGSASQEMHEEPWMNPQQETRNPRRRRAEGLAPIPFPIIPSGGFERAIEKAQSPAVTHVDKALGLEDKAKFVERLPTKGKDAIEGEGKRQEIEHTLNELKDLASLGNPREEKKGMASFHFTPVGGAPTKPGFGEMQNASEGKPSSLSPSSLLLLSPRERVEMRKQKTGHPPNEEMENRPLNEKQSFSTERVQPAHLRRRMGQFVESQKEGMEGQATPSPPNEEPADFSDLLQNPKKKKKGEKEEENDLSLEDDFPLLEDEK
jgi:hypothetical protein